MTNFSRNKLKDLEDDRGEVVVAPPSVQDAAVLLACARNDDAVDYEAFKQLIDGLVESTRHDEQQRAKVVVAIAGTGKRLRGNMDAPNIKTKLMDDVGRAEIMKRLEAAPRSGTGKLRQGWAAMVGAELGYTVSQVQSVIYGRGQ